MNFEACNKRPMSPATLKRALAIDIDIQSYPPPHNSWPCKLTC
jgi:hypothetical protein